MLEGKPMPRQVRSEIDTLLQEARAMELLANETQVPPNRLQEYWQLSADLINLVADMEEQRGSQAESATEDAQLLELRRRMRELAARIAELMLG
jgi:hypothetical protein